MEETLYLSTKNNVIKANNFSVTFTDTVRGTVTIEIPNDELGKVADMFAKVLSLNGITHKVIETKNS